MKDGKGGDAPSPSAQATTAAHGCVTAFAPPLAPAAAYPAGRARIALSRAANEIAPHAAAASPLARMARPCARAMRDGVAMRARCLSVPMTAQDEVTARRLANANARMALVVRTVPSRHAARRGACMAIASRRMPRAARRANVLTGGVASIAMPPSARSHAQAAGRAWLQASAAALTDGAGSRAMYARATRHSARPLSHGRRCRRPRATPRPSQSMLHAASLSLPRGPPLRAWRLSL